VKRRPCIDSKQFQGAEAPLTGKDQFSPVLGWQSSREKRKGHSSAKRVRKKSRAVIQESRKIPGGGTNVIKEKLSCTRQAWVGEPYGCAGPRRVVMRKEANKTDGPFNFPSGDTNSPPVESNIDSTKKKTEAKVERDRISIERANIPSHIAPGERKITFTSRKAAGGINTDPMSRIFQEKDPRKKKKK